MPVRPARFKRQGTGLSLPDDRGGPEEVKASQTQLGGGHLGVLRPVEIHKEATTRGQS